MATLMGELADVADDVEWCLLICSVPGSESTILSIPIHTREYGGDLTAGTPWCNLIESANAPPGNVRPNKNIWTSLKRSLITRLGGSRPLSLLRPFKELVALFNSPRFAFQSLVFP